MVCTEGGTPLDDKAMVLVECSGLLARVNYSTEISRKGMHHGIHILLRSLAPLPSWGVPRPMTEL